ncbi:alpha/beta fold hydrolase [Aeromicrobium chenweiae]|uniref:Alpha/beta hydrolase n=1 Tax=Aeromicrobium chenweiae TaxID=2079793 RepID=A0A2S0WMW3_9ACTN|nr:alpha/beta hydrolase [Aeromicrobium chenweiae]AWB92594.1 alpha/beta hydrolase [Aeromicrobium chenweiae]TGN33581.1 alpha/beta hydrolase [Aeromicrobium chenweiae]
MCHVTSPHETRISSKHWVEGRPVVLSHGWLLDSDSWEIQQLFIVEKGYRAVTHDRCGHGRSTRTWRGNYQGTYADDLACLLETLHLRDVTLTGFSTGGARAIRHLGRHGSERVVRLSLLPAVPPFMLQTADKPGVVPMGGVEGVHASSVAEPSQTYCAMADGRCPATSPSPTHHSGRSHERHVPRDLAARGRDRLWRPGLPVDRLHAHLRLPQGPRHQLHLVAIGA